MKLKNPFNDLSRFEITLWFTSVVVILISFILPENKDYLTLVASLIGVTALIFVAKGYVLGQVLTVVFAVFYGIISFYFRYYGEMITYLCMTAPIAVSAVISWARHPFKNSREVEVSHPSKRQLAFMWISAVLVTVAFYFILTALGNANIFTSTVSITTSFVASYLTYLRSPYYAVAYSANDIVLIILWTMASFNDTSYVPMVMCFVMFLLNDLYGFYNWRRIQKRQCENTR